MLVPLLLTDPTIECYFPASLLAAEHIYLSSLKHVYFSTPCLQIRMNNQDGHIFIAIRSEVEDEERNCKQVCP